MSIRLTTTLLLVFIAFGASANSANEYFNEGIAAFKQHRLNDAVANFKKAKQAGVTGAAIDYNLGVTYYRMGKYELAKESFLLVVKDARYEQAAHYNLGLVCRRLKDYTKALYWFKKAYANPKGTHTITKLAKKMIKKVRTEVDPATVKRIAAVIDGRTEGDNTLMPLAKSDLYTGLKGSLKRKQGKASAAKGYNDPATTAETSRGGVDSVEVETRPTPKKEAAKKGKVSGGVQLAIGHNDNVEQVGTDSGSNVSDAYVELFAWVAAPLAKDWKVLANAYNTNFFDVDQDYRSFAVGVQYQHQVGTWWLRPYIGYNSSYLSGDAYQTSTEYRLQASKKVGAGNWIVLRAAYYDINAEDPLYSYEEGNQTQLRAEYYTRTSFGNVRFRYQYETNDRDDATSTINASADRHEFRVRLSRKFATNWNWAGEVGYRSSNYGVDTLSRDRDDDRTRVSLDLNRKMNNQWTVGGRYTYTDNSSNYAVWDYNTNDVQIYTRYTF